MNEAEAMIERTTAGRLQVTRLGRTDGGSPPPVFQDEAEALRHLTGP